MLGVDGSANTQGSAGPQTCAQAPLGLFGLHPIEMCPFPEGEGASPSPTPPLESDLFVPNCDLLPSQHGEEHGEGRQLEARKKVLAGYLSSSLTECLNSCPPHTASVFWADFQKSSRSLG